MDPDNMYEEETVELNNESDVKEHNTDSEGDMHEVVVGEEEVIEHRLEEVVIFDNPQGQVSRPGTRTLPQVIKKEGVKEVHKVGEQPRGQSVLQVNKGQIKISRPAQMLSPVTNPNALKRKAEASPMIVRLDNLKKPRPGESPIARTAQSKVRIVRHSTAQTDMTGDIMEQYQQIIEEDQQKIAVLEDQLRKLKYTPEMFENDDKRTEYFTGMETFVTMITLYNTCEADLPASSALTKFEIYIMTLLKLRLKLPIPFLGYMFGIGAKAVTYFYNECLGVLHTALREVFSETIEAVDVK